MIVRSSGLSRRWNSMSQPSTASARSVTSPATGTNPHRSRAAIAQPATSGTVACASASSGTTCAAANSVWISRSSASRRRMTMGGGMLGSPT